MNTPRTLFAGIGSAHGDDRVGWLIADALREIVSDRTEVRQASTPSDLLDWLTGFDRLVVCDACLTRTRMPDDSRLHRWSWPTRKVEMLRSTGSHTLGLPQVLKLAERLGTLPDEVVIFGVEGSRFDAFAELSSDVGATLDATIKTIAAEISKLRNNADDTLKAVRHA